MADAVAARIAAASGDAGALLALAIELNAALAGAEATVAAMRASDEERRCKQRTRTRNHRNVTQRDVTLQDPTSRDVTLQNVTERDVTAPPSPSPSSSSPTPLITPSSPPSPQHSAHEREIADEQRLLERAPAAVAAIRRVLDAAGEQRNAWVDRLHSFLDRAPRATGTELRDGLEDMMTKPRDQWGPLMLREFVRGIRAETAREVTRAATAPRPPAPRTPYSSDAPERPKTEMERAKELHEVAYRARLRGEADRWLAAHPTEAAAIDAQERAKLAFPLSGTLPQLKSMTLREKVVEEVRIRNHWPTIGQWNPRRPEMPTPAGPAAQSELLAGVGT